MFTTCSRLIDLYWRYFKNYSASEFNVREEIQTAYPMIWVSVNVGSRMPT